MNKSAAIVLLFLATSLNACGRDESEQRSDDAGAGPGALLAGSECTAETLSGLTSPSEFSWKLNEQSNTIEVIGGSNETGAFLAWAIALKLSRSDTSTKWQLTDGARHAGTLFCSGNSSSACLLSGAVFAFTIGQLSETGRCATSQ